MHAATGPSGVEPGIAALPISETLARLQVDPAAGLTAAQVDARRAVHGYNEVAEEKGHPVARFLARFWGVSAWMLEAIIVLSIVLGKLADLVLVSGLLVVNAVVGFLQERRAAGAVEALRSRLQVSARVLRGAAWQVVAARELVPGDILRVRAGDVVPADAKVLAGSLGVDLSALTGESAQAARGPSEVVPAGSVVRRGEADAVAILTGRETYFGRTTELVREARPKLHIEVVVARVVRWLFAIVVTLLALVTLLAILRGVALAGMASLLLVLLMSAVPVALPVMFTASLAIGARELARRGVLVTRLSAAEDAATMDVLCVDKTGTITANRLTVVAIESAAGASEPEVLLAGARASRESNQDPIDLAFLAAARERGVLAGAPAEKTVSFAPFDAASRRTEAIVERDGARLRALKGAVRTVAGLCASSPQQLEALEARVRAAAMRGYRTLAVAQGPEGGAPRLLGLVMLHDPPRADASELIAKLAGLGIAVKMLTGDALAVAREVGSRVGLPNVRRAADLVAPGGAPEAASGDPLAAADGLAEIYPEDKYRVVRSLQAAGHVTGMTGDGVNDAPALRQAEVGIAVSSATDVARSAASVVLTEPGLTNIVALVEQGRTIYQRLLTWILNKVSRTILKAGFVSFAYIATGKFVVSAFAMLLLVSVTDFAKISIATDRVRASSRPETWRIGGYVAISVALGAAMLAETLALLWLGWERFGLAADEPALHTFSFLTLLYFAAFSVISIRERRRFWATRPSAVLAAALLAEIVAGTLLTWAGMAGLPALPAGQTLAILGFAAFSCLGVNDALKVAMLRMPFATARPDPSGPSARTEARE